MEVCKFNWERLWAGVLYSNEKTIHNVNRSANLEMLHDAKNPHNSMLCFGNLSCGRLVFSTEIFGAT